jgi:hypothetical protein
MVLNDREGAFRKRKERNDMFGQMLMTCSR